MSYPAISSRRMPYDVDGSVVGVGRITSGIVRWLTAEQLLTLNLSSLIDTSSLYWVEPAGTNGVVAWVFFPEKREIEQIWGCGNTSHKISKVEGSNDTTNGLDGTWETAYLPSKPGYVNDYSWRDNVVPVSFSTNYRALRITMSVDGGSLRSSITRLHLYGSKAAGENPDDIIFCDSDGDEITSLKDWGDRPEGTMLMEPFYLKNVSADKVANGLNIQLNDTDFLISFDQSTWQATLNIETLGVGQVSAPIYVKNTIGNPNQTLGPRAARVILTITSWS